MEKLIVKKVTGHCKYGCNTENVTFDEVAGFTVIARNGQEYIISTTDDGGLYVLASCTNSATCEFVNYGAISTEVRGRTIIIKPVI